ncbi:hypothetical protein B0H17DRAFT_1282711 [Mycena rosella]|uniref:Uncharacterized protein n=1 Tax=Mycena rosella TaxID=1033263 RepID=A0AAD7DJG1_MYCRO|nr:hypothetical protein B0H17DRAFT_1282711 [Mycena rosella]
MVITTHSRKFHTAPEESSINGQTSPSRGGVRQFLYAARAERTHEQPVSCAPPPRSGRARPDSKTSWRLVRYDRPPWNARTKRTHAIVSPLAAAAAAAPTPASNKGTAQRHGDRRARTSGFFACMLHVRRFSEPSRSARRGSAPRPVPRPAPRDDPHPPPGSGRTSVDEDVAVEAESRTQGVDVVFCLLRRSITPPHSRKTTGPDRLADDFTERSTPAPGTREADAFAFASPSSPAPAPGHEGDVSRVPCPASARPENARATRLREAHVKARTVDRNGEREETHSPHLVEARLASLVAFGSRPGGTCAVNTFRIALPSQLFPTRRTSVLEHGLAILMRWLFLTRRRTRTGPGMDSRPGLGNLVDVVGGQRVSLYVFALFPNSFYLLTRASIPHDLGASSVPDRTNPFFFSGAHREGAVLIQHGANAGITDADQLVPYIVQYSSDKVKGLIRYLPEFDPDEPNKTFTAAKQELQLLFGQADEPPNYTESMLRDFCRDQSAKSPYTNKNQIETYHQEFTQIAGPLFKKAKITKEQRDYYFVSGIPTVIKEWFMNQVPANKRTRSDPPSIAVSIGILQKRFDSDSLLFEPWKDEKDPRDRKNRSHITTLARRLQFRRLRLKHQR